MKHDLPFEPQFYVTAPQPCPYLEGRLERKLFTGLHDEHANTLNNFLSGHGFRRSQNVLYRPACAQCSACISVRIRVADFIPSRSQRRVMSRNRTLKRTSNSAWATDDQYEIFHSYLKTRHIDGGMADMDMFEFATMIEDTPVFSRVLEYYTDGKEGRDHLLATCLSDVLADGLSMVYSFFDPDHSARSLGRYMILDHINIARALNLRYVYLGYWVENSPKMAYKADFSALEYFDGQNWVDRETLDKNRKSAKANKNASMLDALEKLDMTPPPYQNNE